MRNRCGYGRCLCYGVRFISIYKGERNYCVNGNRVKLNRKFEVVSLSTTDADMELLGLYLLDDYAAYLEWRSESRAYKNYQDGMLIPFNSTYPLRRAPVYVLKEGCLS